jgi:hypothetical protein
MIYFIQAGEDGPIKITITINPQSWLQNHQRNHYEELRIIQQIPGDTRRKAQLKETLKDFIIRGDWFEPADEVIDCIRDMKDPEYLKIGERAFAILYRHTEGSPTELCPFCGACHVHGSNDGFRTAHCMKDRADAYVVTNDGTKLLREKGYILKTRYKA